MNSLYGDNIFESTDMKIFRLNNILENEVSTFNELLENNNIILTEGFHEIIEKIKELWRKFKEFIKGLWDKLFGKKARTDKLLDKAEEVAKNAKKSTNESYFINEDMEDYVHTFEPLLHYKKSEIPLDRNMDFFLNDIRNYTDKYEHEMASSIQYIKDHSKSKDSHNINPNNFRNNGFIHYGQDMMEDFINTLKDTKVITNNGTYHIRDEKDNYKFYIKCDYNIAKQNTKKMQVFITKLQISINNFEKYFTNINVNNEESMVEIAKFSNKTISTLKAILEQLNRIFNEILNNLSILANHVIKELGNSKKFSDKRTIKDAEKYRLE